jgi:cell division cycle 20-like protein 1 (cofactor of APC complex)
LSLLKVLDAPELQDNFNLNLLDWSAENVISAGLGKSIYTYCVPTSQAARLCDVSGDGNFVTSVSWNEQVSHISFSLF